MPVQTQKSCPDKFFSGSLASVIFFSVFSVLGVVFVVTILLPAIIVSSFSTSQAQSVPPHAGMLRGSQGGFYCDNGYHLVGFHMNIGNSNNAFYYQCNSNI
jgi:hypothetical protein